MHWYPTILENQLRRRLDALFAAGGPRLFLAGETDTKSLLDETGRPLFDRWLCLAELTSYIDSLFRSLDR